MFPGEHLERVGPEGDDHALTVDLARTPDDHAHQFLVTQVDAVKVPEGDDALGEPFCNFC